MNAAPSDRPEPPATDAAGNSDPARAFQPGPDETSRPQTLGADAGQDDPPGDPDDDDDEYVLL